MKLVSIIISGFICLFFLVSCGEKEAKTNIRIAAIEPLSGPYGAVGQDLIEGLQFQASIINNNGGVLGGRNIEIIPFDNAMKSEKTTEQLRKAIDQGIQYVTQGVGSSHALNIIKQLQKHNNRNPGKEVLFLNNSAVTTAFTNELCTFYHFRFDANVDMKVAALVTQIAKDKSVKKVYLINQDYVYGKSFQSAANKFLTDRAPNVTIVGDELIVPFGKILDFTPYVTKIKSSGADTVLTGNWGPDGTRLITAVAEAGLKIKFYSIYAGIPSAMNQLGNKAIVNPILQVTESHENDSSTPDWLRKNDEEYFKYANKSPTTDRLRFMIEMFAQALDKAKSSDPKQVAFALEGATGRSAHGEVNMRKTDHQAHFDMVISHISQDVERPFMYNGDNYGMAYETDGWIKKEDITLETSCKMDRPNS